MNSSSPNHCRSTTHLQRRLPKSRAKRSSSIRPQDTTTLRRFSDEALCQVCDLLLWARLVRTCMPFWTKRSGHIRQCRGEGGWVRSIECRHPDSERFHIDGFYGNG